MKNNRNLVLIAGILAIGLVAASILGGQSMTAAAQQQPTQNNGNSNGNNTKPTVSTTGTASTSVEPDKVSVTIGVETNGTTAEEAAAANAELMQKVIDALKALGIADSQIATSHYSIYPVYDMVSPVCIEIYPQPPECKPRSEITGYRAVNSVTVTADASSDIGKIIDAAVGAGANNVNGAYFFISEARQQEIRDSLIEKAIDNARSRADKAASAVDMNVTGVHAINLNDVYFPVYFKEFAASADGGAPTTPIVPGQQQVTMNVQVVFTMG
ncbi:SIMPL domain-containing protein [Nitrososphaera viennensis]|nr:SIMPL domain-containing protein [Nitrososphaera viennensis]UVS69387.1 SIMPL domain-containing protein [Nitrososphaera viennensis]